MLVVFKQVPKESKVCSSSCGRKPLCSGQFSGEDYKEMCLREIASLKVWLRHLHGEVFSQIDSSVKFFQVRRRHINF